MARALARRHPLIYSIPESKRHPRRLLCREASSSVHATVVRLCGQRYAGPIVIGGGLLSEQVCQYVGANHWSTDAVTGVDLCQRLVASQVPQEPG